VVSNINGSPTLFAENIAEPTTIILSDTMTVEPWQALEFFHFANVARSQR